MEQNNLFFEGEKIDDFIKSLEDREMEARIKREIDADKNLRVDIFGMLRPILFAVIVAILIVSFFLLTKGIIVKVS